MSFMEKLKEILSNRMSSSKSKMPETLEIDIELSNKNDILNQRKEAPQSNFSQGSYSKFQAMTQSSQFSKNKSSLFEDQNDNSPFNQSELSESDLKSLRKQLTNVLSNMLK